MPKELILQGRTVSADDIDAIKQLIEKNPPLSHTLTERTHLIA
jgi:hypothetical protein